MFNYLGHFNIVIFIVKTSRSSFLVLFLYTDLFNDFSDCGIDFQIDTPILVKYFVNFFLFLKFLHSFEDDLVL